MIKFNEVNGAEVYVNPANVASVSTELNGTLIILSSGDAVLVEESVKRAVELIRPWVLVNDKGDKK